MPYDVGVIVQAIQPVYDVEVDGRTVCVAWIGDIGKVEYVSGDGAPLVRWERTGQAMDCCESEIAPLWEPTDDRA